MIHVVYMMQDEAISPWWYFGAGVLTGLGLWALWRVWEYVDFIRRLRQTSKLPPDEG